VTRPPNFDGLSLDPGKWKMGLCGSSGGVVTLARTVWVPGHRWDRRKAVEAVLATAERLPGYGRDVRWTLEKPQVYPGAGVAVKKDTQELRDLVDALVAELRPLGHRVVTYEPRKWKGQIPKPAHHRRVLEALSPAERDLVHGACDLEPAARLDIMDAVGLELFALKRVGRGGRRKP